MIRADITIENLIKNHPEAIGFLIRKGLPCVVCGEPFWGTLTELAEGKGFTPGQIEDLVTEFNRSIEHRE